MSVPKLRFKEFKGEWKLIKLGKIADKITSGARDWAQYYSENGSKFIRMTNLSRDGIHLKLDDLKFVNVKAESSDGQRTSLIHGDILISITAELGKIGWIPPNFGEAFINQHTGLVRLKKDQADSLFIAYLLSTAKLNKQINRLNDSGAKSGLNLPTIASINMHLPKISEQNKIADFLVTIDEKIAQLTQKCELLARYKKGVMQQIFSQDLRFKDDDGRDFPDWEEILLGEIISFENGKAHESSITDNGHYIVVNSKFISSNGTVIKRSNSAISPLTKDSVVMVMSDVPNGKALAKCYFIEYDNKYTLNQRICSITSDKAISKFLFYQINRNPYYLSFDNGVGQTNLRKDDVLNCPIMYPLSLEEQIKIANFLTSIDEKITEAQTYLDTVKRYKQGLLQQMFV